MLVVCMLNMNYFIYIRKSSEQEDRQVLSLESQERELKILARKLSLKVVGIFRESKSAKYPGRPIFNEILTGLKRGKAEGLIGWQTSRFSRNSKDTGELVYLLDMGQLTEIVTPSQTFRNTPNDKFLFNLLCSQDKLENDNKGVNVKNALKSKAERGWLPSGAKPGYMNDKFAERGNKTILSDPIRFPLMRKAWELMLTGTYTIPKILEILNKEWGYLTPKHKKIGGKPMCRSTLYLVFSDPFYYGEYEYPRRSGTWHQGKHIPMITREEYDKVQQLLGRKGRPRPKSINFDYSGLLICGECGGAVTAEEKWQIICPACKTKFASKNKDACIKCKTRIEEMVKPVLLHYIYYHCTKRRNPNCTQKSIRVEELELQINDLLARIQISERFKNWAIKHLNELNDSEIEDRNVVHGSLTEAYKDCIKRIDNLIKLKISPQNSDGTLFSDDEFKQQKMSLLKEKAELEEKMRDTEDRIGRWVELSEKTFNLACHARYWFEKGTVQEKRELLLALGSNLTLKEKTLHVDLQKPLGFLVEAKKEVEEISPMFEPAKKGFTEAQMTHFYSRNPTLLPG